MKYIVDRIYNDLNDKVVSQFDSTVNVDFPDVSCNVWFNRLSVVG